MSKPDLRYLSIGRPEAPRGGYGDGVPGAIGVLRLTTPKGTLRESHLDRRALIKIIQEAAAVLRIMEERP